MRKLLFHRRNEINSCTTSQHCIFCPLHSQIFKKKCFSSGGEEMAGVQKFIIELNLYINKPKVAHVAVWMENTREPLKMRGVDCQKDIGKS